MKHFMQRIEMSLLAYIVALIAYLPIVWLISLLIQEHHSLTNALYAYLVVVVLMVLSFCINYITALLDIERPWIAKFIFTLVFGIFFTPVYFILAPIGAVVIYFFPKSSSRVITLLGNITLLTTGIYIIKRGRVDVARTEDKLIIAFNHRSSGDYWVPAAVANYRNFRVMIGANLWRFKKFHWFFNAIGIPIEREKDRTDKRARAILSSKNLFEKFKRIMLMIFIEGTRNRNDDIAMCPIKPGAAKIAIECGVKIQPILIINMQKWRRPGPQITTTFDSSEKKRFKWNPKHLFAGAVTASKMIFTEGINPTIVKLVYLDPISPEGHTFESLTKYLQTVMEYRYKIETKAL